METIRLQKFLAQHGFGSRRGCEVFIEKGQVLVNGKKAKLGDKVVGNEEISVNGKKISQAIEKEKIFAFYKPRGVECTMKQLPDCYSLYDFDFGTKRIFSVGRLDKDSHGLLLMTNNGDLAHKLAHPKFSHEKEYIVSVNKELTSKHLERLENGSIIIDEKPVNTAQVKKIKDTVFSIILTEGRNRQIRRMCESIGLKVVDLMRVRIEKVHLGSLKEGRTRQLNVKHFQ